MKEVSQNGYFFALFALFYYFLLFNEMHVEKWWDIHWKRDKTEMVLIETTVLRGQIVRCYDRFPKGFFKVCYFLLKFQIIFDVLKLIYIYIFLHQLKDEAKKIQMKWKDHSQSEERWFQQILWMGWINLKAPFKIMLWIRFRE